MRACSKSAAEPLLGRGKGRRLLGAPCRRTRGGRSRRTGSLDPAGFTLLEVLVAFTILALMMTVLLRIFSEGFRGMTAAEVHAAAALHAQAAMASVGAEIPLTIGEWTGKHDDGFRWRVSIELYEEPAMLLVPQRSFLLYRVLAAAEHASGTGAVTLSSLRIGRAEPQMFDGEEAGAGAPR